MGSAVIVLTMSNIESHCLVAANRHLEIRGEHVVVVKPASLINAILQTIRLTCTLLGALS